jgi:predicted dehydrogenase
MAIWKASSSADPTRSQIRRRQNSRAAADWQTLVARDDVDLVIVSTTNDALAAITLAAVRQGKHVLVEKPAARNAAELAPGMEAARAANIVVKVPDVAGPR